MGVTEDLTSPGMTTGVGSGLTIASAPFTPPASTLVVAMVSGEWSRKACSVAISDSGGHAWDLMALATGSGPDGGVSAIFCTYMTAAPATAITVTGTFTALGGGRLLDVRVLNGAASVQSSLTGWSFTTSGGSTGNGQINISTIESTAGSVVYGISDAPTQSNVFTANGSSTTLGAHNNTVDSAAAASWKAAPALNGSQTLGGTWGTATAGNVAAFEVLPVGGTAGPPTLPTFVDGTVPHAADLNALGANISQLYSITSGGARYAPYVPGGKGPIKPLTVLSVTNPAYVLPASGDLELIQWDTVLANTDGSWSPLDSSLLVVNTGGLWRLHLQVQVAGATDSPVEAAILVNGAYVGSGDLATYGVAYANAEGQAVGVSATLQLPEFAFMYCYASQSSNADTPVGLMQYAAEWLGP